MLHTVEIRKDKLTPSILNNALTYANIGHDSRKLLSTSRLNKLPGETPTSLITSILNELWSLNGARSVQRLTLTRNGIDMDLQLITDHRQNKLVILTTKYVVNDEQQHSVFIGYSGILSFVNTVFTKLALKTSDWRYI